jgi:hypothetical protein
VTDDRPLSTLLSQLLVAFTMEFDNEFEHRMPHRTTAGRSTGRQRGPWLVSQAMWANLVRFVPAEGIRLGDIDHLAGLSNLSGLDRWGYVDVAPDPADSRPTPRRQDWVVRPTRAGIAAQRVWAPLATEIEERWAVRFGRTAVADLRSALETSDLAANGAPEGDAGLSYLPTVSNEMFTDPAEVARATGQLADLPDRPERPERAGTSDLSALLARTLLRFTLDVESASPVPMPVGANVLRVLDEQAVPLRELPGLTGVSTEAVAMSRTVLTRHLFVEVGPDPVSGRGEALRLTSRGQTARAGFDRRVAAVEAAWHEQSTDGQASRLRTALTAVLSAGDPPGSQLAAGLEPYPDGWRAQRPYLTHTRAVLADPAATLPHHPMVLHRGGYPDGS